MEKSQARRDALRVRDELSDFQINEKSEAISERFLKEFTGNDSYLLYYSFKSEVQTHALIDVLYGMKKTIYLPSVDGDKLKLGLYEGANSLSDGAFGIQEPVECITANYIDIAVVPGVAFDKGLHRVGYGKGYYDRLFGAARCGLKVGFAFECQLFEAIDYESHDIPVDVLVTENKIYRRNS